MIRELLSADPRVGHADLARGSAFFQTYCCLPEGYTRDPRVLPADPKLYNICRFFPEGLSRGDTTISKRISERVQQLYQASATKHALLGKPWGG